MKVIGLYYKGINEFTKISTPLQTGWLQTRICKWIIFIVKLPLNM